MDTIRYFNVIVFIEFIPFLHIYYGFYVLF